MPNYNITLNSSNVINNGYNNQYQINFLNGGLTIPEDSEMSISQITIPYCWNNVSSFLGNNKFSYQIGSTNYPITLADGFYGVNDINNALQAVMKSNGHYWYNTQGVYSQQVQFTGVITGGNTLTLDSGYKQVQLYIGYVISYIPVGQTAYSTTTITAYNNTSGVYTITSSSTNTTTTGMVCQNNSEITPVIIYPITITANTVLYTTTITSITIPTSSNIQSVLGANFVNSNGQNGQPSWSGSYPSSANTCAYLIIPTTSILSSSNTSGSIGNILGFQGGNYPSLNSSIGSTVLTQSVNGNSQSASPPFPPTGSVVNGVVVRCNLVNNQIIMPSDILDCFPITSTFGSNINYLPLADNSISLKSGKFSNLLIQFSDQNFNPLLMLDSTVLISLIIRFPSKK